MMMTTASIIAKGTPPPRLCEAHWWEKKSVTGIFTVPPGRIVSAYSEHQPLFYVMKATIPNIMFYQGQNRELFGRPRSRDISVGRSHVENHGITGVRTAIYCHLSPSKRERFIPDTESVPAREIRKNHFPQLCLRDSVP